MKISEEYEKHPKIPGQYTYGTAGFRMKAELLDSIIFTVGLIAVLRSKSHNGATIGVMITASHNPEADNGVKLVEPLGEMLDQSWESYAIRAANAETGSQLETIINEIAISLKIDMSVPAKVVVARDTRPSGKALVASLIAGVNSMGGNVVDYGILTTPQLHYITRCLNTENTPESYGEPTASGYHLKLASAYKRIVTGKKAQPELYIDGANGVGAVAMNDLAMELGPSFPFKIFNSDINTKGVLNHECGADYVKMYQKGPKGLDIPAGVQCCSLDGDADRIVFYYKNEHNNFKLLDGDKIATLAASFIMSQIREAKVSHADGSPIKVGLVQTAYANGSSTSYVRDVLKVPVVFTPTGVKHLHHEATHFDVGVYFEANGHGTVLFSKAAITAFHSATGSTKKEKEAISILCALTDLINQTVGDALSDMLMISAILTCTEQSFPEWDSAYTDLPSRQEKVKVKDRTAFVPINADTELAEPKGLQNRIVAQVEKFKSGRCFVRPSGTEDVVRVYAEAATVEETEMLSQIVCGIVFDYYGGVGERPTKFKITDANGNVK